MKIKIEKAKDYNPMVGSGNGEFYGYAFADYKRVGIVWTLDNYGRKKYICNEDFDKRKHSRENRPKQWQGCKLVDLKKAIAADFE